MRIEFSNFGPIAGGAVRLKPLTILIGPNQAGKSFAAMASHAMFRAMTGGGRGAFYDADLFYIAGRRFRMRPSTKRADAEIARLHTRLRRTKVNQFVSVTGEGLEALETATRAGRLKLAMRSSMEEVFASTTPTLLRHGCTSGSVKLISDRWHLALDLKSGQASGNVGLTELPAIHLGYVDKRRPHSRPSAEGSAIGFRPIDFKRHRDRFEFEQDLREHLERLAKSPKVPDRARSSYVPAIRSGLLKSHILFLSLLVRNVQRVGLEPFDIPQMTGVTADFLSSLLRVSQYASGHHKLGHFEEQLTGGHVYSKKVDNQTVPAYFFKTPQGLDIPLNLASSTVSEIASIFMVLQSGQPRIDWLIIEEPESHLSPDNQATMAKFLATLANTGTNVIITTHSTFLMEQVNNLITSHNVNPGTESLNPDQVSAHYLDSKSDKSGSKIIAMEIDPIDGIDMSPFTRTYQRLYDESFDIKRRLSRRRRK